MTPPDSADDPPFACQGNGRSFRLRVRARISAAKRRLVKAALGRCQGSAAQDFLRQRRSVGFANSIVLFGASLLPSVLPFIILLSSLATHRIDTDLSRHTGLSQEGARVVSQLFRSSPAHSAAPIVTALVVAAAGTMAVAGSPQVIYERVFGQQHRGWRDVLRFLTWVAVLFGVLVTESVISNPVHAAGGPVAQGRVSYAGTAAFFWWTMHFLLAGRVVAGPGRDRRRLPPRRAVRAGHQPARPRQGHPVSRRGLPASWRRASPRHQRHRSLTTPATMSSAVCGGSPAARLGCSAGRAAAGRRGRACASYGGRGGPAGGGR